MIISIREALAADINAITGIYNYAIENTTSVFSEEPVTEFSRRQWWEEKTAQGFPVLVATAGNDCVGFASYGYFRPWPGYRFTVENAIYMHPDAQGKGGATLLLSRLTLQARKDGFQQMIAGIGADNDASLRLHEKCGFVKTGMLPRIAFKFGRWLDLQFMQRTLG